MRFKFCHKCLRTIALGLFLLCFAIAAMLAPESETASGSSGDDAPAVLAYVAP